jgi:hypothetical protein
LTHVDNYIITHYILRLDYCSTIWREIIVKNTERITKFTKKISPHYSKLWYFNSIKFYVLSLLDDYHFQIVFKIKIKIVFMYKIINGLTPFYMSYITENIRSSYLYLRSFTNSHVCLTRPNTNLYKKSFHFTIAQLWNNWSMHVKKCPNIHVFKKYFLPLLADINPRS